MSYRSTDTHRLSIDEELQPVLPPDIAEAILLRHLEGDCGDTNHQDEVLHCLDMYLSGGPFTSVWEVAGVRFVFVTDTENNTTIALPLSVWNERVSSQGGHSKRNDSI